jgi:hypothetical protein
MMKPSHGLRDKLKLRNLMPWLARLVGYSGGVLTLLDKHQKKNPLDIVKYFQEFPKTATFESIVLIGCLLLAIWEIWQYATTYETSLESYRKTVNNMVVNILKSVNGDMPKAGRATVYVSNIDVERGQKHYYYAIGRYGNTNGDLNKKKWWFYEAEESILHDFQKNLKDGQKKTVCISTEIDKIVRSKWLCFFSVSRSKAWQIYWKKKGAPREILHSRLKPEWYFGIKLEYPESQRFVILLFESQRLQDTALEKRLKRQSDEIKKKLEPIIEAL